MPSFSQRHKGLHGRRMEGQSTRLGVKERGRFCPLERKVKTALARFFSSPEDAGPGDRPIRVGVGVSGGPDSVALLSALLAQRGGARLHLSVLHVNHGLRPEADHEQRHVERLCRLWQLPCFAKKLDSAPPRRGIEAWARNERYQFFEAVLEREGLDYLALAHTRDDQAETVLFRLLRGSARRGLSGIPPSRTLGTGGDKRLIRPLLDCTRQEVLEYLADRRLSYVTDPSNADLGYARNRIRHRLLPLLATEFSPRISRHLAHVADTLREEEAWLETATTAARLRVQHERDGRPGLRVQAWAAEPAALRARILRQWLEHTGHSRELGFVHLEQVRALAEGQVRGTVELPGSLQVRLEQGCLLAESKRLASEPYVYPIACGQRLRLPAVPDIPGSGWQCWLSEPSAWQASPAQARTADPWRTFFDARLVSSGLRVRSVRPGDRIFPLGMAGRKKIHDVFSDAKLPRRLRQIFPLVVSGADDSEVAWVPGHVRGKTALVTPATRSVCQCVVSPLPEKAELC